MKLTYIYLFVVNEKISAVSQLFLIIIFKFIYPLVYNIKNKFSLEDLYFFAESLKLSFY